MKIVYIKEQIHHYERKDVKKQINNPTIQKWGTSTN